MYVYIYISIYIYIYIHIYIYNKPLKQQQEKKKETTSYDQHQPQLRQPKLSGLDTLSFKSLSTHRVSTHQPFKKKKKTKLTNKQTPLPG